MCTREVIPRKWEYIADQLRKLNAPKKVINAATEIDNAMVKLGLGHNTYKWGCQYEEYSTTEAPSVTTLFHNTVMESETCTACEDAEDECHKCALGDVWSCTPRSKHADLYFTIVRRWFQDYLRNG